MEETDKDPLKKEIYDTLHRWFGYNEFRSRQYDAIYEILKGKDVIVLMPTGGGKSLCYQIPPLVHNTMCVVVSPLIALMQDQIRELKSRKIPCALLSSSQTASEYRSVLASLSKSPCCYNLLYVTPERFQIADFIVILQDLHKKGCISLIAIDEAHCISTWGHDFRAAYRGLSNIRDSLPNIPIMALSATATSQIVKDIKLQLKIEDAVTFSECFDRPNIFYSVVNTENLDKYNHLLQLLKKHMNESTIIYVRKKDDAETIRDYLVTERFAATVYHGSLPNKEKEEALQSWIRGTNSIIVATIAFGMGINKNNVRLIIHWNLPQSLYNYYQESGRAGRDGLQSESVVYYNKDDAQSIAFTIKRDTNEKRVERLLDEFQMVIQFCKEYGCRRKALLKYFQQEKPKMRAYDCCDYCRNPEEVRKSNAVLRRLPTSELMHSIPVTPFQTARDLYKQTRWKEDEESYEEKELNKKKREWNRSSYHVNNQGNFTDSEEDDDEEEEDMHSQLKRMALANTVPTSLFCKASTLAKASQKKEQENMKKKRPSSTSISQFLNSKEGKFVSDKEEGRKMRNEGEKSFTGVETSGIKDVSLSSKMLTPSTPSIKQPSPSKQSSPSTPSIKQPSPSIKQPSPSKQSSPSSPSIKQSSPSIKQPSPSKQSSPSTPSIKQPSPSKQSSPSTPSIKQPSPSIKQSSPSIKQPSPSKQSSPSTPSKPPTLTTKSTSSKSSPHTAEKKASPSKVEPSSILPNQSVLSLSSTIDKGKVKQLVTELEKEIAELQPYTTISSKQRVKCVNALRDKYKIALQAYLPEEVVEVVALQQARLQEHAVMVNLKKANHHEGKQCDIRNMFVKKEKKECIDDKKDCLKKYKSEFTTIFSAISSSGVKGVVPPFLPLNENAFTNTSLGKEEELRLMSKCRISLLPFFHPDYFQQVLKHVVLIISKNTPKDSTKDEYVKSIHLQVNKAIKKKQPFLIKESGS